MKRLLNYILLAMIATFVLVPTIAAQVDYQQSFGVMRKDGKHHMLPEGGNWKITFSDVDTLGNSYRKPVQLLFDGALYPDTLGIFINEVDSLLFETPETQYAAGVFEIDERLFGFIVDSDTVRTIYFRIDCLTRVPMPKVGQKVVCNIFRGKLPNGFMGRVENINVDYLKGWVEMKCGTLGLEEVYDVMYASGVSGASPDPEVTPQEVVQRRMVLKRLPTRADDGDDNMSTDFTDNVNKVESITEATAIAKKLTISDKGKIKVSALDDEDNEGPITFTANVKATSVVHFSIILNRYLDFKRIEAGVDFSAEGKVTFEMSVDFKPDEDDKKEFDFITVPIPVVVIPGVSVNIDFGITWDYLLEAKVSGEAGISINRSVGFVISGDDKDVTWTDTKENNRKNPFNFGGDASGEVSLKGELFLAFHVKVGIGIAGEGLEFQFKFGTGPKVSAQLTYKIGQIDRDLSDKPDWFNERSEMFSGLNEGTNFVIEWGALIDMGFYVANDSFSFTLSDFLEKFGIDNTVFWEIFRLDAAPNTSEITKRTFSNYEYKGTLKNSLRLIFPYDAGLIFVDDSPNALYDEVPDYVVDNLGEFKAISPNDISFSINLNRPELKGRLLSIYPYAYNTFFTGYGIIGKLDELYIPYKVTMRGVDKAYESCQLKATFEKDVLQSPYINEGGFILRDIETNEEISRIKLFEGGVPKDTTMQTTLKRGDYKKEVFKALAYIYDSVNDEYMYSYSWDAGFQSYYAPETLAPEDITSVGAVLNGSVHQSVLDEEGYNHMDNKFSVGFTLNPGNHTSTALLNDFRTRGFDWNVDGKLQPEEEYTYRAFVIDNTTSKRYLGPEVKFKSKPVFYDFEASVNYDNVFLGVMTDRGFVATSDKSKYKVVVSEDQNTWENGGGVELDGNQPYDRSDYLDEMVIVRIFKIDASEITRDHEKADYDIGILSEKGWEPGRTYFAKVIYDDGNGKRIETKQISFKIPAPIDNFIEVPEAVEATLTADVLYPYGNGKSEITIEYSKKIEDIYMGTADDERVDNKAAWELDKNKNIYMMAFLLEDLDPSTTYYYRYVVEKTVEGVKTTYKSEIDQFKTKKLEYKVTLDPPSVEGNNGTLRGRVNDLLWKLINDSIKTEADKNRTVFFEISKDKKMTDPLTIFKSIDEGQKDDKHEWELELPDLNWDSKFYCRLSVQPARSEKIFRSEVKGLNVGSKPENGFNVQTFDAVLNDEWTTLKGKVNSDVLNVINTEGPDNIFVGFEYAPSKSDLDNDTENVTREVDVTLNTSTGLFSKALQLKPNTTYYYRSFVYYEDKFIYGSTVSFTTADYDSGLIVPDMIKRRQLELKAVINSAVETVDENNIIVFDKRKLIKKNIE